MGIVWLEHLSPGERLGEILFGIIMTLTFTLGAGVWFGTAEGASSTLMIATIGCNVAWGVIDAALFLLGTLFDRGRLARVGRALVAEKDEARSMSIVAAELDEILVPITQDEQRIGLYKDIITNVRAGTLERASLHRVDYFAALVVFVAVVLPCIPAVLPYLIIDDPYVALRTSNVLQIGMLFWIGYHWAGYTTLDRRVAGFMLTAIGVGLVLIALALGG